METIRSVRFLLLVDWLLLILLPSGFLPSLPVHKIWFDHIDDFSTFESHHTLDCSHCFTDSHVLSHLDSIHSFAHFYFYHEQNPNVFQSIHFPDFCSLLDWELFDLGRSRASSEQWVDAFDISWFLHSLNVFFVLAWRFILWIRWDGFGLKIMVEFLFLADDHAFVLMSGRGVNTFAK